MPYPKCRYFRHPDYGYVMAKSFRYTGGTIFTLCIVTDLWIIGPWHCVYNGMFKVIDRLLTFSHIYWKKYSLIDVSTEILSGQS